MKITNAVLSFIALNTAVQAAVIPEEYVSSISLRSDFTELVQSEPESLLEKRKGGGGGRSSGSSSSSSSSSSGSSSGSSSSGGSSSGSSGSSSSGSSSGGSSSSSSGRTSGTSNTGGRSSAGSGVRPTYGGGSYYSGGAAVPYSAGARSPLGVTPYFLGAGALGFAGVYAYGAWAYPYSHPYSFRNQSQPNNSTNTTLPVECLCQQYQTCGCDDNTDDAYLSQIVGNGSTSALNATVARIADVNGTQTLIINGTLANGTTASGGTDDSSSATTSAAGSLRQGLTEASGWYFIAAGVVYTCWFM